MTAPTILNVTVTLSQSYVN